MREAAANGAGAGRGTIFEILSFSQKVARTTFPASEQTVFQGVIFGIRLIAEPSHFRPGAIEFQWKAKILPPN